MSVTWSWLEMIRRVDPEFDRDRERRHTVVYEWPSGRKHMDGEGVYGTNTQT